MSAKCFYCGKTVYHAEEQVHDGNKFHIQCFGKFKKEDLQRELAGRNATYQKQADVQPAYYRVGDPSTGMLVQSFGNLPPGSGAQMETGSQYRTASGNIYSAPAPAQAAAPSSGGASSVPYVAVKYCTHHSRKFCPECGAKNNGGKFCGECGFKF